MKIGSVPSKQSHKSTDLSYSRLPMKLDYSSIV